MTRGKRFSFSSERSEKNKREGISRTVDVLQEKYPEVLGMSLFGSLTKGGKNGSTAKDIDGYIYLNADVVAEKENVETDAIISYEDRNKGKLLAGKVYNPVLRQDIAQKYEEEIRQELIRNNPDLEPEQVKHVWVFPINEAILDHLIDGYIDENYEAGDVLRGLFHLRVGQGGIQKYRKLIIDRLERLGDRGEKVWQRLIKAIALFEQDTRAPGAEIRMQQRYYPQTLRDARRMYC